MIFFPEKQLTSLNKENIAFNSSKSLKERNTQTNLAKRSTKFLYLLAKWSSCRLASALSIHSIVHAKGEGEATLCTSIQFIYAFNVCSLSGSSRVVSVVIVGSSWILVPCVLSAHLHFSLLILAFFFVLFILYRIYIPTRKHHKCVIICAAERRLYVLFVEGSTPLLPARGLFCCCCCVCCRCCFFSILFLLSTNSTDARTHTHIQSHKILFLIPFTLCFGCGSVCVLVFTTAMRLMLLGLLRDGHS